MGFYEDDRIRAKNNVASEANDLVNVLRQLGLSDSDIASTCKREIPQTTGFRNEIYSTVLRIVGGSHVKSTD